METFPVVPGGYKKLNGKAHSRGKEWKPGQSGNPGGKPKMFGSLIRDKTKQGEELVTLMLRIARGSLKIKQEYVTRAGTVATYNIVPAHDDRIKAVEWLTNRGWGKVAETMVLANPDGSNVIPREILNAAIEAARLIEVTSEEITNEPARIDS